MAQNDGYDRNKIIGGYKGAPIKNSMLGRNLKTRGALSNNLPFRLANSLAPGAEYQFLFPTGTEAGAVWRFSQSGEQYQDTVGSYVTAVGQSIGLQRDIKYPAKPHSVDYRGKTITYSGGAATTSSVGGNIVTFTAGQNGDTVDVNNEFPVSWNGRAETELIVSGSVGSNIVVYTGLGAIGVTLTATPTLVRVGSNGGLGPAFRVGIVSPGTNATIIVSSITEYPGNHLSQATQTSRPLTAIESIGGWNQSAYSARLDGVDDGIVSPVFAAGTLTNNMDFFCAIKRTNTSQHVVMYGVSDATHFFAAIDVTGAITTANAGAGYTIYVDGINVLDSRALVNAAVGSGAWHVLEYRNLDLSSWTQVEVGGYPLYMLAANMGDVILCPAQSTANRNLTRTLVGASVGLIL